MEPLSYNDLSPQEKIYLGELEQHPGFNVFKKLVDDAFRRTMVRIINLKRDEPNYHERLEAMQIESRITKEVCEGLVQSISMHSRAGVLEKEIDRAKAEEDAETVSKFGTNHGSIRVRKPRKQGE